MICRTCRDAADYAPTIGGGWARNKHRNCQGCDCQHRVPPDIPHSMTQLGTPESRALVALAASIELDAIRDKQRWNDETYVPEP
jgi:hypothetical protein